MLLLLQLVGKEVNKMADKPEFWRWTESRWTNPDIDWKGKIITSGVDVGSVSSQAVILADGELYA